ncbi:MAG: ABC-2 transporter permease [Clostridia bacterium]|nr:ABC-2 transporter permease [Clostridia bacterium]
MQAIYKREFKSFFTSPIGYVILGIFYFFLGFFFAYQFKYGYADVTFTFSQMFSISLFIVPIITMRLMSEDKRQKTDQALLTSPVSLWGIVLGKYFAALTVFALGYLPTLLHTMILSSYTTVEWLLYFGNLLGALLLGASMIAAGLFISGLTESQIVAAVSTFALSLLIMLLDSFAELITAGFFQKLVEWFSFSGRYNAFMTGIVDIPNLLFFISFAAIFLFLSVRVLEKRRYA